MLRYTYYHNTLLTRQQLPVMCEICCEFFIFQRNNVSAQWTCTASVSVSSISAFWILRNPCSFNQACGFNTQIWIQWTTKFVQKYNRGLSSEKLITCMNQHHGLTAWHGWQIPIIDNATDECCIRFWVSIHVKGRLAEYTVCPSWQLPDDGTAR